MDRFLIIKSMAKGIIFLEEDNTMENSQKANLMGREN